MSRNRLAGTAKEGSGVIREAAGTASGDAKLVVEAGRDQVDGMIQNFIGCVNDAVESMPRGSIHARKDSPHVGAALAHDPQARLRQS